MKITRDGYIMVEENGRHLKKQCFRNPDPCGLWCPLFKGPIILGDNVTIEICENVVWSCNIGEFIDER